MQMTRENITYTRVEVPNSLNGFKGWEFSSGLVADVDFKVFARLLGNHIRKIMPPSAGIHDSLCGWDWLLTQDHPQVELIFSISMGGARFSATLNPDAKNKNIVRDLSRAAMR